MDRTPVVAGLIEASSARYDLTRALISNASPTPTAALLLACLKPLARATRLRCSGCSVLNVPTSVRRSDAKLEGRLSRIASRSRRHRR